MASLLCIHPAGAEPGVADLNIRSLSWSADGAELLLDYDSEIGKTYRLQQSPSMGIGSWDTKGVGMEGDGGDQTLAVSLAGLGSSHFFRLTAAPTFKLIPEGSFQMGDQSAEPKDGFARELPVHSVELGAFSIQATEVTKAQWDDVYNAATSQGYTFDNRGVGKGPDHPVHTVSWFDVVKWCNALSELEGLQPCYHSGGEIYRSGKDPDVSCDFTKDGYRLPTEAEWEKAARGGIAEQRFPWGELIDHTRATYQSIQSGGTPIVSYDVNLIPGWHPAYAIGERPFTAPVGCFAANSHGLYDMSGNVWEWCWDWFSGEYYSSSPASDPQGPGAGPESTKVARGGSWAGSAAACRNSHRGWDDPTSAFQIFGFRPVRTVNP